ncbi:MAG: class I SAM-dependent methyltransferase [Candidatus Brocadia sp.]|nr:class I SAM-dependent methyltransferase [Candidatus Brocadia sp.]
MDIRFANFLKYIIRHYHLETPKIILIFGCGSNNENTSIKQIINPESFTIGIDIDFLSLVKNQYKKNLLQMNGSQLGFKDDLFDCVFSYHALEHITDYSGALENIKRVLKPNSFFLLGVPNKRRILGYIGSKTTLYKKIQWNINDLRMKCKGKFENRYGAHAGFTKKELSLLLNKYFVQVEDVTVQYYVNCYPSKEKLLKILDKFGPDELVFPSLYYLCFKECK